MTPIEKAAEVIAAANFNNCLVEAAPLDKFETARIIRVEIKRELENTSGITMTEEQAKGWVKLQVFLGVRE